MHFACDSSLNQNPHIVALLILAGADANLKNSDGATPKDLAKAFPAHLDAIKDPANVTRSIRRSNSAPSMSPAILTRRTMDPLAEHFSLDEGTHADDGERKHSMMEYATSLLSTHKPKDSVKKQSG